MKLTEKSSEVLNYVKDNGGKVSIPELVEALGRNARSVGANVTDLTKKELAVRDEKAHESRHHFEERVVFAGCGVMAVGTNESNTYRRTQRKNMVF